MYHICFKQGGAFEGTEAELFELPGLGVRLGCELVDVEGCWGAAARAALARDKGLSLIVASFHDFSDK